MARPLRATQPLALDDDLRAVLEAQAFFNQAVMRLAAHVENLRAAKAAAPTGSTLLSIKQLVLETSLSRARIYQVMASGRLPFKWIDGRRVVRREDFERFVDELPAEREA